MRTLKKQARARKSGRLPAPVKWIIAVAVLGAAGYGLSQMSTVAYGAAEIKVVDFSGLDATQKRHALEAANAARCTCGCGMTLAQCVVTDIACPIRDDNIAQIRRIVDEASRSTF